MTDLMKGISCCADCAYYNMKKHRCTRSATDEGDARSHFYADCPLPDVVAAKEAQQPEKPIYIEDDETWVCGSCGATVGETFLGVAGEGEVRDKYCPECGRAVKWDD